MAVWKSTLLLLVSCVSTCLAESPFNGALVGVVVVVALLLSAIVATAVALLIVWIRWQRSGEESSSERVNLESQHRMRDEDTDNEYEEKERESQLREPVRQPTPEVPVYSTPVPLQLKPPVRGRADSFTSDDGGNQYQNVAGAVGAAEPNHYDDTLQFKPTRRAPPAPSKPQEESKEKEQVREEKLGYENTSKGPRRAPPPRPVIVGEEEHTATSFSPIQKKPGEEEEKKTGPQLPQVSPAAVKLRPAPPAKPKSTEATIQSSTSQSTGPPAPPTKPQSSGPPAPPTKPQSSGPPAPPNKPHSTRPPAPPTKPQSSGPPAPPTKPQSSGPPAPPTKPHSTGPPAPPTKPQSSGPPAPPTKPQSSGPPAPPTKPHSTGPPAPPTKPQSSGPPAPPTKPQSSGPPAPPNKPKFTGPPPPPTKPQPAATKPKPQIQPRPAGLAANPSDNSTPSSSSKPPKPKVKPRVPAKPSIDDGEFEQDSSVPVPVGKFGEHVASQHADGNTGFSLEFNSLPMGEFGRAVFDAIMPLHACRNRHANIIPYNDNRPKLEPIPGNRDCQHDYINASFVDGLSSHHRYIAAQGPKKVTIVDFWRLVWQEKVPTIAMVTALQEDSGRKCERYWPEFGTVVHGPYRVSLSKQQVLADYTLSTLQVQPTTFVREGTHQQPLTVQHMHFTGWLDHETPEQAGPLLSFLRRLNSLHDTARGPLLVHCSAGVGRTGSLLAIDLALEQARREGTVDIPAIVSFLRRQRMKMIQTQDQYMFIHDAVLEQWVCGDTQIQATDLNRTLPRLQQPQQQTDGTFRTELAVQFDVLQQVSPKPYEVSCRKAMMFPNKNRSTDFLPPDERQVELRGSPGYIHASFAQGYRQKEAFIIAQAPLEETCRDFWKMVHERECGVIVMLTAPLEEHQLCAQYWSEEMDDFDRQYGDVYIHTAHRQQMSGYAIHRMTLTNRRSGAKREVVQFQLTAWTEDNLWSSPSSLVEAIHHIKAAARKAPNKPIVVHGRDTVSRCGLLCALMVIIDQCATEGVVDVFQVVKALRLAKPGCVPSFSQYQQLFHLTAAYLDSFDTYANFK